MLYNKRDYVCRCSVYICRWLWIYKDSAGLHYATVYKLSIKISVKYVMNNHWHGCNNRNQLTNMTITARKMVCQTKCMMNIIIPNNVRIFNETIGYPPDFGISTFPADTPAVSYGILIGKNSDCWQDWISIHGFSYNMRNGMDQTIRWRKINRNCIHRPYIFIRKRVYRNWAWSCFFHFARSEQCIYSLILF